MRSLWLLGPLSVVALGISCSDEAALDVPTTDPSDGGTTVVNPDTDSATIVDSGPTQGLRAEYFSDFSTLALSRVDPIINFAWSDGTTAAGPAPGIGATSFSIRWTGTVQGKSAEKYTVSTLADDGIRVWIDGKLVIDNWTQQAATEKSALVDLDPSKRTPIRIEYFQYTSAATAKLSWASATVAKEIIPSAQLLPDGPADGGISGAPKPDFQNAVVKFDCPDPGILRDESTPVAYYMVCTGGKFPIRKSDDLVTWADTGKFVLPTGAAPWAADGFRNWAPEIHKVGNQYVAYYTASGAGGRLSIGAAHAPDVLGPYTDRGTPLIRDASLGAIDATFFTDGGKNYLYWKLDGNAVGQATPIYVQELTADGLNFASGSSRTLVVSNNASTWEGGVVEAPWVIKRGTFYYLFYSGNVYDERYATGVARATSPLGPFTKKPGPIMKNNGAWVGPGHGSVVVAHGKDFFFHHAWPTKGGARDDGAGRWGLLDPIIYQADWPTFTGDTSTVGLQAWP